LETSAACTAFCAVVMGATARTAVIFVPVFAGSVQAKQVFAPDECFILKLWTFPSQMLF